MAWPTTARQHRAEYNCGAGRCRSVLFFRSERRPAKRRAKQWPRRRGSPRGQRASDLLLAGGLLLLGLTTPDGLASPPAPHRNPGSHLPHAAGPATASPASPPSAPPSPSAAEPLQLPPQPSSLPAPDTTAPAAPVSGESSVGAVPLERWPSLGELLTLPGWMTLTLTINAAPIANPIGGLTAATNWMQQNELNLAIGSGLALETSRWRGELDHWQARLRLDAYNGQPTYGSTIGSLFAPQTMAYPPGFYLSNVSLQRSSRDHALKISAGIQSIDQDFLVNQPYTNYLYSGFNDTLNLSLPGLPITPYAAPSLVVHWRIHGWGSWRAGTYWLDQETELAGLLGAPPALTPDLSGSLQVLQWDLPLWAEAAWLKTPMALPGGGTVERQLSAPVLQLGAFRSSVSFVTPLDSPTGRTALLNHVLFGAFTLPARLPLGLDNRFWGTLQWGLNPSQNITPVFLAGGWQCQGLFPGRPLDVLSLGVGRTAFSPQLLPQLSWAGAVELNYSFQISNRLSLQPVLQWLLRPAGEGTVPAILTTSLQLNLSL